MSIPLYIYVCVCHFPVILISFSTSHSFQTFRYIFWLTSIDLPPSLLSRDQLLFFFIHSSKLDLDSHVSYWWPSSSFLVLISLLSPLTLPFPSIYTTHEVAANKYQLSDLKYLCPVNGRGNRKERKRGQTVWLNEYLVVSDDQHYDDDNHTMSWVIMATDHSGGHFELRPSIRMCECCK